MASLDSFNLSQHLDSFVSLLSVWHLQTSIRFSFCLQFASLNRLSSPLFFLFAKDSAITSPAQKTLPAPTADCVQFFWTWQTALTQWPWVFPKFKGNILHSSGAHLLFSHLHCKFSQQNHSKGHSTKWQNPHLASNRTHQYWTFPILQESHYKLKYHEIKVSLVTSGNSEL